MEKIDKEIKILNNIINEIRDLISLINDRLTNEYDYENKDSILDNNANYVKILNLVKLSIRVLHDKKKYLNIYSTYV